MGIINNWARFKPQKDIPFIWRPIQVNRDSVTKKPVYMAKVLYVKKNGPTYDVILRSFENAGIYENDRALVRNLSKKEAYDFCIDSMKRRLV